MESKLITLAIQTFEKAQVLKTILESEGIDVYIHNVNQIQPVVSAGVRVRIKESDLPHALRIIEDVKWFEEPAKEPDEKQKNKKILIPVDFSDYSLTACEIGVSHAGKTGSEVVLLHAYFSPFFPSAIPMTDSIVYQADSEAMIDIRRKVEADMEELVLQLDKKMKSGELPHVNISQVLREGIPEEEIIAYAKEIHPVLIVMGTRGKSQKEADLIGSVSGEVIEISKAPVLVIPEKVPYHSINNAKNIAFATSFNQEDLVMFERFMEIIKGYDLNIHLFNISTSKNEWNEIRLTGVREYFKKQYPDANITHTVLDDGDLLLAIERFVREKNIDIIALSTYRRNLLARIFNPGIARKMLFHTDTALLVMHR
jgi:Universal stress protein UspA and related nucleotide-binding proteins